METVTKRFGSWLTLVYHCFDRIVIQGYLPLLTPEAHIVQVFRDVHHLYPITKEVLRQRTTKSERWAEDCRLAVDYPFFNRSEFLAILTSK